MAKRIIVCYQTVFGESLFAYFQQLPDYCLFCVVVCVVGCCVVVVVYSIGLHTQIMKREMCPAWASKRHCHAINKCGRNVNLRVSCSSMFMHCFTRDRVLPCATAPAFRVNADLMFCMVPLLSSFVLGAFPQEIRRALKQNPYCLNLINARFVRGLTQQHHV